MVYFEKRSLIQNDGALNFVQFFLGHSVICLLLNTFLVGELEMGIPTADIAG